MPYANSRFFVTLVPSFLALMLGLLVVLQAADTLPASIPDDAYWKMISDFSERGGKFDFEMYMSNEATFQTILPSLLKVVPAGGVYLGVGPEQNFTYITNLRPKIAFIIDIRRENMLEHLMYKALFELSPNRADFLSRLFSRRPAPGVAEFPAQASADRIFDALGNVRADSRFFAQNLQYIKDRLQKTHGFPLTAQDTQTIDFIMNAFARGGPEASLTTYGTTYRLLMRQTDGQGRNRNFLSTESSFQFVRQMQQRNLIIPVVGDFAGPRAMRAVGQYLREHNASVAAFYVSNVEEYIQSPRSVWSAYCRNLASLPVSPSGVFIRFGRAGRGSFLGSMPPFIRSC
jgi:hypothetical protein